jgi:hypothetical protein
VVNAVPTHDPSSYLEGVRDGLQLEAILEPGNTMGGRHRADCDDKFVISIFGVRVWAMIEKRCNLTVRRWIYLNRRARTPQLRAVAQTLQGRQLFQR